MNNIKKNIFLNKIFFLNPLNTKNTLFKKNIKPNNNISLKTTDIKNPENNRK